MESLLNDFRYGARRLWKSKGLTLVAVVSLAAGIGANAAIFGIVNSILFRPRAVSHPEQLLEVYTRDVNQPYHGTSYPSYLDFRERNQVFSGLAAYGVRQFRLGGTGDIEQVWGEAVSGNYFDVLGVRPHQGRTFLPEEDSVPGRNPVVVIGYGLWQRRFAANPAVIGQTITLNNQRLTVVGIAPPEYTGMMGGLAIELWVPAMVLGLLEPSKGPDIVAHRGSKWLTIVGRLKPGATIEQARARFDVLAKEMQAAHPQEWTKEEGRKLLTVSILPESQTRVPPDMRPVAWAVAALLFVIVDLVLLIACMNLASMLFARAVARRSEIAVRLALGAGRFRIIRQLLAESVLLALIAGVAGVVLAIWALELTTGLMPPLPEGIRVALNLEVDWLVVAYTLAFATVTGVLFGLAPALHSSKASVSSVLKDDSAAFTGRFQRSRLRMSLVIGQVAFSLLLLIGAGLVLRSLEKVRPTRLGYSSDNIVVAQVGLEEATYERQKGQQFYETLSERVAALPGVQSVSMVNGMPGGFMSRSRRSTEIEGYAARADESLEIDVNIVSPGYFTNMKIPVVHGRDFTARDREGAPCVAIVNEAFAHRYLAGPPAALGKHLARWRSGREKQMCEIVGVVRDNAWQSLQNEVRPVFTMPLLQDDQRRTTLMVSAAGDPTSLISPVRQVLRELDPTMPVADVQTIGDFFAVGLYPFRILGFVIGFCGLLSLLLATIGIYGTVTYSVAQRTREVGIRMALGALRNDILRLVVGQAMTLVGYGLGIGVVLGLLLTRVLMSLPLNTELLFGVSATDSLTFVGVTLLLAIVALIACYVPALRATKVDPMASLRSA